jgi:dipeptidyl aminopeptidase/acylaminoacyl peptidase
VDASYKRSSGTENAWRLKGHLLMIFGEQDSNVDPSSSLQVVNALIKAGKDFDLLEVPGGEHTVGRSTGPIYYVERRQFAFFVRHLQGGTTPDWNGIAAGAKAATPGNPASGAAAGR